jgi:TonB-linked SusC/RagA family outer membrane protein
MFPAHRIPLCLMALLSSASVLAAQGDASEGVHRGPRFFYVASASATPVRVDLKRTPVLARRVDVALRQVTIEDALKAITAQAGLKLMYSPSILPLHRRVSLDARDITVAGAIGEVLFDLEVDVVFSPNGQAMLVPRTEITAAVRGAAVVSGRVTDSLTGAPVRQAQIAVESTALRTTSDDDGRYSLAGVPSGAQRINIRRLGFEPVSLQVTVPETGTLALDVRLGRASTRLAEIVTTVTGDQRRLEIGNALARIDADAVSASARVRTLPELVAGRAAGVLVYFPNGVAGEAPRIRVRGTNSLTVKNDPLVIIDGVRVDHNPAVFSTYSSSATFLVTPQSGRLSDLSPDEIENVEIVKGPSAATLYGTDAANGVVVVTTKRGQPGRAQWTSTADVGTVQPRGNWQPNFFSWGHSPSGTVRQCTIVDLATNACVVDSLTSFSPLENSRTSPFGAGHVQKYGLQVSGGSPQIRYFLSGEYNSELGVLRLNDREQRYLQILRGVSSIPDEQVHPNLVRRTNLRANVSNQVGRTADVAISAGLVRSDNRIPRDGLVLDGAAFGAGTSDTLQQWFGSRRPGNALAQVNTENVTRTTTSATTNWRPLAWLTARATLGLDYATSQYNSLIKRGDTPLNPNGAFVQQSIVGSLASGDVSVTAERALTAELSSRTSVGGQLNRNRYVTTTVSASSLAPGASTAAGAATISGETVRNETAVAGSYLEEVLGFRDRLFVTGALRFDGASTFGRNFATAAYPKAALSWMVLMPRERTLAGQSSLRLRSAYGSSGVQPGPLATVSRSVLFTGLVGGIATNAAAPLAIGNPDLKPERQTEIEAGFDADARAGRIHLELTAYNRESSDALINQPLPFSFGLGTGASKQVNIGKVRNRGLEGLLGIRAIESARVSWDIQLNGNANQNRLVKLAPNLPVLGSGISRNKPGFPINGLWDRPILGFADANSDGIIAASEVTLGDSAVFLGPVAPTRSLMALSTLNLFQNRLSLNVLLDHRSGFARWDGMNGSRCDVFLGSCRDINDPNTPLDRQAAAAALNSAAFVQSGYVHDGSFTSLRELSVSVTTPAMARLVNARTATVALVARNLHVWTGYPGVDAESTNAPGADFFSDNPTVPPSRYLVLRARLTF